MYDNKILTTLSHVLMTQKEAAEYLHTTVGTLNTWRHYGKDKIPFVRWGNRIRYRKEDLWTLGFKPRSYSPTTNKYFQISTPIRTCAKQRG